MKKEENLAAWHTASVAVLVSYDAACSVRVLPGGNSYISQQGRRCWIGQICEGVIVVHHVASKHARTQLPVIGGDLAGPRFLGMCKVRYLAGSE